MQAKRFHARADVMAERLAAALRFRTISYNEVRSAVGGAAHPGVACVALLPVLALAPPARSPAQRATPHTRTRPAFARVARVGRRVGRTKHVCALGAR